MSVEMRERCDVGYISFDEVESLAGLDGYVSCIDPSSQRQEVYKIPERLKKLPSAGETTIRPIRVNSLKIASCSCFFVRSPSIKSKEVSYYELATFSDDDFVDICYELDAKDAGHVKNIKCEYQRGCAREPFVLQRVTMCGLEVYSYDDQLGPTILV